MNESDLVQLIRTASNKMRRDDNTKNASKYLEHFSWLLFLKVWDTVEEERALIAQIDGQPFQRVVDGGFRWSQWTKAGLTGPDLTAFINDDLFPRLRTLSGSPTADKIAEIFRGVTTIMKSGYVLAEVIEVVDKVDFHAAENYHTMSVVYETLLAQTSDAGWSGEYYTPRPIVEFMVSVIQPQIGQDVYDPCSGSAGFLASSFEHMRGGTETVTDHDVLQRAFHGQEVGELSYLLGTMNMMLHGVFEPDIVRRNTLEEDIRAIDPSRQHDVILTNPPFGGTENPQVQQNFPARSARTELLFLQHVMAKLRKDGRCGIVMPDAILFRTDAGFSAVRRRLLDEFNLTGVVRLPRGVFPSAPDALTSLLFFDRTATEAKAIRYYAVSLPLGKSSYSKTVPLRPDDLEGALSWLRDGVPDQNAWEVQTASVRDKNYTLDLWNPNASNGAISHDAAAQLGLLHDTSAAIGHIADQLAAVSSDAFEISGFRPLASFIVERGNRSGGIEPDRYIGVSNAGGITGFKGAVAKDTSRYRRVEVGDVVYNPMRANVGSLALCRSEEEAGYASPDYVVFGLRDDAPFSAEYLLRYLKSGEGRLQIDRNCQGSVRRRLYFENLTQVEVPLPAHPEKWEELLESLGDLHRRLLDLPDIGAAATAALQDALFRQDSR